ncbi:hypothetical protein ACS0TY_036353 [Phlomoides rotata]
MMFSLDESMASGSVTKTRTNFGWFIWLLRVGLDGLMSFLVILVCSVYLTGYWILSIAKEDLDSKDWGDEHQKGQASTTRFNKHTESQMQDAEDLVAKCQISHSSWFQRCHISNRTLLLCFPNSTLPRFLKRPIFSTHESKEQLTQIISWSYTNCLISSKVQPAVAGAVEL